MKAKDEGVSRVAGNFNRIARDLDRAICLAGFTPAQWYLFSRARELCWSFAGDEPRPFRFNFCAEERLSGFARENLSRQCGAMIARGFFADAGGGMLLVDKRYPAWRSADGKPLLSPEQLSWCRQAAGIRRKSPKSSPVHCDASVTPPCDASVTLNAVHCDASITPTVTPASHHCDASVTPTVTLASQSPYIGSRLESLEREREKERVSRSTSRAPAHAGGFPGREDHQTCVELALELFGDRAADAVARLGANLAADLEDSDGSPRWDCYAAALREADRARRRPGAEPIKSIHAYALTLAREWVVMGIPPDPVEAPVVAAPEVTRPPSKSQARQQALLDGFRRKAEEARRKAAAGEGGARGDG